MKNKIYVLVSGFVVLCCLLVCLFETDNTNQEPPIETSPIITAPPVVTTPVVTQPVVSFPVILEPTHKPTKPVVSDTISITGENRVIVATMIAKTIYGEARGIESVTEQACVAWTILNRVDAGYGNIVTVITTPNQFAYSQDALTVDDYGRDLVELALDVISRWEREHAGEKNVGRVLPKKYLWFGGENGHNWFRDDYRKYNHIWNYSLPSPYES